MENPSVYEITVVHTIQSCMHIYMLYSLYFLYFVLYHIEIIYVIIYVASTLIVFLHFLFLAIPGFWCQVGRLFRKMSCWTFHQI